MIEIGGWAAGVLALIGIVTALAAAAAIARGSFAKAQIEALRGDRDDLQRRVEFLEDEYDRTRKELQAEKEKVDVLTGVVTGEAQLQSILTFLDDHGKTLTKVLQAIENVNRELKAVKVAVTALVRKVTGGTSRGGSDDGDV